MRRALVEREGAHVMLTVGVDLAAQAPKTALAAIEWSGHSARLVHLQVGVSDAQIVELSRGATSIGIDCPFGWPIEFVDFLAAHRLRETVPRDFAGKEWRQRIRFRETDRHVRERIGKWPLSVATDLLSLVGMHGAELLEAFEVDGVEVDRAGTGVLVEVYPAASSKIWKLDVAGYKKDPQMLSAAVDGVLSAAPWLSVSPEQIAILSGSDDALDSLLACLTARAHALGQTEPVPEQHLAAARVEGWIALPVDLVANLAG